MYFLFNVVEPMCRAQGCLHGQFEEVAGASIKARAVPHVTPVVQRHELLHLAIEIVRIGEGVATADL